MAIKLHRCGNLWVKLGGHPCWKVQKALDEAGIRVRDQQGAVASLEARRDRSARTRQSGYPWIEFEDGSIYREESKEMAQRIKEGKLSEAPRTQPPAP